MKKIHIFCLFCLISLTGYSQNIQLDSLGETPVQTHGSAYISLGDSIYQFFGDSCSGKSTVYSFKRDTVNITSYVKLFEDTAQSRHTAIGFEYNNELYVGFGNAPTTCSSSNGLNDFYRFNLNTYNFDTLLSFPNYREYVNWFIYNNKLYVGMGYDSNTLSDFNDFFEYDFNLNTWSLSNVSCPKSGHAQTLFVHNGFLYIGSFNSLQFGLQRDFYKIDLTTNSYIRLNDIDYNLASGVNFQIQNNNLILTKDSLVYYSIYKYDIQNDSWFNLQTIVLDSNVSLSGYVVFENGLFFVTQNILSNPLIKNKSWYLIFDFTTSISNTHLQNNIYKTIPGGFILNENVDYLYILDSSGRYINKIHNYISNTKIEIQPGVYILVFPEARYKILVLN